MGILLPAVPADRLDARKVGTRTVRAAGDVPQPVYLPLVSTESQPFELLSAIGGKALDVAIEGHLAVVLVGAQLVTVDVTDSRAPRFLGESPPLPFRFDEVVLQDGFAWVSTAVGPLLGFDVRDPSQPRLVSTTTLPGEGRWFAVSPLAATSGTVYVGVHSQVHRVDVTDPLRPRWISALAMPPLEQPWIEGKPHAIAARGGDVFVVDYLDDDFEGLLLAVDWSQPNAPHIASSQPLVVNSTYELALAGNWLLAARWHVEFFDVSDPAQPRAAGWIGEAEMASYVRGPRLPDIDAYVGTIDTSGDRAWLLGDDSLWQLRLGPRWPPELVSTTPGVRGGRLASGPSATVVLASSGGTRLDVVDAVTAQAVGTLERLGGTDHVLTTGRRAYVDESGDYGARGELAVLDVSDPGAPRFVGRLPIDFGDVLYAEDERLVASTTDTGVQYWDVRDPQRPVITRTQERQHVYGYGPSVRLGETIYVPAHGTIDGRTAGGLYRLPVDGSGPPEFWPVSDPPTSDAPSHVASIGGWIVAANTDRYWVVDATDSRLRRDATGQFTTLGSWLHMLTISDDYLIASDGGHVEVHRLTWPEAPVFHSAFELPTGTFSNQAVVGRAIITAAPTLQVWILGQDFRSLQLFGGTDWSPDALGVRGDLVAAASTRFGLRFYRLRLVQG